MCRVVRQMYQCVRRARLAIWKRRCWNGSNHLEAFTVLHLNCHVLQDLIIQCVAAVKLTHTHTEVFTRL